VVRHAEAVVPTLTAASAAAVIAALTQKAVGKARAMSRSTPETVPGAPAGIPAGVAATVIAAFLVVALPDAIHGNEPVEGPDLQGIDCQTGHLRPVAQAARRTPATASPTRSGSSSRERSTR